jgi:hypothetical protein
LAEIGRALARALVSLDSAIEVMRTGPGGRARPHDSLRNSTDVTT